MARREAAREAALELLAASGRLVRRFVATSLRALFVIWIRLPPRARIGTALAVLGGLGAMTSGISSSLSGIVRGLAVVLLVGVGLWMIAAAPFRRRRW